MSMINDALRRASSAAKSGSGAPPMSTEFTPPPPLPGTDSSFPPPPSFGELGGELPEPPSSVGPGPKKQFALPQIVVLLLACGTAGLAGYYFFWQKQKPVAPPPSQHGPVVAKVPEKAVAPVVRPVVVAPPPVAAVIPTPAPAPVVPVVPVRFPPLRLQSIFYRPENPSVIINGKTLFINDQISGVLVTDIRSSSVTLVLSGQTNILTLR